MGGMHGAPATQMRPRSLPPGPRSLPPGKPAQHAPDSPDPVSEQLVDEVWQRARASLLIGVGVLLVSWPIVRGTIEASSAALVAYLGMTGLTLARWLGALWAVPRLRRLSPKWKWSVAFAGVLGSGCLFALLSVLVYRHTGPIELGLWLAIVTGITGGAAVSLGARPDMFAAYTVQPVASLVVATLVWPRPGITPMTVCLALWIAYSLAQVVQYRRSRVEFIAMNVALNAKNTELVQKNVALEEMTQRANRIFSALAETLPGRTLASRYKLESRIGSGGFSIVFRAMHLELQRAVAVKIFRPEPSNDSAAALERFRFEGMAGSRTRHPNIVEVMDAGISDDGIPYIAMELLDGRSLDGELGQGVRLPLGRACGLLSQACRGLAAAHAAGVIHRDIKPENIFVHHDGGREIVKVLDFGIAKVKDTAFAGMTALTGSGTLLGTPLYMAPERFLGRECTEKADAYSVGVILYRALAGELPFQGTVAQ